MSPCPKLAGGTALATLMLAQSAAADITPAEVWDDLRGYLEGYGYTVSAETVRSGDRLTLTDLTAEMQIPEDDAQLRVLLPELTLTATGDGAVALGWPAEMPIRITASEGDESVALTLLQETRDPEVTISGDAEDAAWAYAIGATRITLTDLVVDGTALSRDVVRGEITLDGLLGTAQMRNAALRETEQEMTVTRLSYEFAGSDPESPGNTVLFSGGLSDLAYSGTATLPRAVDSEDPMALMSVMDVAGSLSYSQGRSRFNGVEDGEAASFSTNTESARLGYAMAPEAWSFDLQVEGYDMQLQGGDLPFPVALEAGTLGGTATLPVARTETPQDVAATLTLEDFRMSDLIWNIFDPAGQLPRDPATVALDVSGKVRMLYDLFDPAQAEALATAEMPAELHALTLNALVVDAVGAMLTATGAFTFDNTDLESFDGLPRPEGQLTAELRGANRLIDTLVAMGILPEQQAMGARMMMGMFAVNKGDDTLSSTLEINDKGHIIANGQRIQ